MTFCAKGNAPAGGYRAGWLVGGLWKLHGFSMRVGGRRGGGRGYDGPATARLYCADEVNARTSYSRYEQHIPVHSPILIGPRCASRYTFNSSILFSIEFRYFRSIDSAMTSPEFEWRTIASFNVLRDFRFARRRLQERRKTATGAAGVSAKTSDGEPVYRTGFDCLCNRYIRVILCSQTAKAKAVIDIRLSLITARRA